MLLPPDPKTGRGGYTTSVCLSNVDNRTGSCHAFGVTGGAIRVGDFKLLVSHPERAPWEDSSPAGIGQGTPGGRCADGKPCFTPTTPTTMVAPVGAVFDKHLRRNISVYMFDIKNDPTESNNLANSTDHSDKLKELLDFYNTYAAKPDTVMGLSWRYGFQDKHAGTVPPDPEGQHCTGEFNANGGSDYCHFAQEWECFVRGREPSAGKMGTSNAGNTTACQAACASTSGCKWWVLRNSSAAGDSCDLYDNSAADATDCDGPCDMGPSACPGMSEGAPERRAMTDDTVLALVSTQAILQLPVIRDRF